MLKGGGHTKCWGSFYVVARSFSHIEGGVGGQQKVLPCIEGGGGTNSVGPAIYDTMQ